MDISEILAASGAGITENVPGSRNPQELGKNEFMTLLVTQLQNQDPFEPVENTDFITQLAQFSTLEQAEQTTENLGLLADYQQSTFQLISLTEGANLIGKEVTYYNPELDQNMKGVVESLDVVDSSVTLRIGGYVVPLGYVLQVAESTGE
ncbi:MAG: flagellar hook assembly protein FlgD [Planctomycetota bacterium]|jgi:flagellar basal-body rod modification protein FlgD